MLRKYLQTSEKGWRDVQRRSKAMGGDRLISKWCRWNSPRAGSQQWMEGGENVLREKVNLPSDPLRAEPRQAVRSSSYRLNPWGILWRCYKDEVFKTEWRMKRVWNSHPTEIQREERQGREKKEKKDKGMKRRGTERKGKEGKNPRTVA